MICTSGKGSNGYSTSVNYLYQLSAQEAEYTLYINICNSGISRNPRFCTYNQQSLFNIISAAAASSGLTDSDWSKINEIHTATHNLTHVVFCISFCK